MQNYERKLKISPSKWKYQPLPSQNSVKSRQKMLMRTWQVLDRAEQHCSLLGKSSPVSMPFPAWKC